MTEKLDVKEAVAMAIQMEKDGREFYLNAADRTSSDVGRTIFTSLADDELVHLRTFKRMFEDAVGKEDWDELVDRTMAHGDMPVFPKDISSVGVEPDSDDLEALKIAMEAEANAIDYYGDIRYAIDNETVEGILDEIIKQERRHYVLLEEEFFHLQKSGYWHEFDIMGEREY